MTPAPDRRALIQDTILNFLDEGRTADDIIDALVNDGWSRDLATSAVVTALNTKGVDCFAAEDEDTGKIEIVYAMPPPGDDAA